mgnify:FL=1
MTDLTDTLAPIATRLAQILEDKAALEAEERALKAQIRDLVPGPDTYAAGGYTLAISTNRRFDPDLAARVIPTELLELCKIAKVDSAAAKAVLPPALYTQCMKVVGDDRVGFVR